MWWQLYNIGINFEVEKGTGSVDASTGYYTPIKWVPCNDEVLLAA
jgi:hypothetical protein